MKGILEWMKRSEMREPGDSVGDSQLFTQAFADHSADPSLLIPWEARATEIGAKRLPGSRGLPLLKGLWAKDKSMNRLEADQVAKLERFFDFALVAPDRDIIRQEEYGNFMIVLLTGTIVVERVQPWGERLRLAEARPGDILGEMSLLDSGMRFSLCGSLTECEIAVLSAEALDEMMGQEPALAACLIALLARKLSLRLRAVSARLSDRQNQ